MSHQEITSLHSPHVERVKALLGSRGTKARKDEKLFVADGLQSVRSALTSDKFPVKNLFLTESGKSRLLADSPEISFPTETFIVSDAVMSAMSETQTPQGILALCSNDIINSQLALHNRIAYFWQLQDPGNAGTVIRTADACGFDAVVFSPESVDIYSPKVVRSTAGSLWNIDIFEDVDMKLFNTGEFTDYVIYAFDGKSTSSLEDISPDGKVITMFGNEARGLPDMSEITRARNIRIPMHGRAESLNVASAASIAMFHLRQR